MRSVLEEVLARARAETYPLPEPWSDALDPARLPGAPFALFPAVEQLARRKGLGDVLDGWGDDIALIKSAAGGPS